MKRLLISTSLFLAFLISAYADDDAGGILGAGKIGNGVSSIPPALTFTEDATTLLANPFRGFQVTASGSEHTKNTQSLGTLVSGEVTYRRHWEALHTAASTYDFVSLQDYFAKVRATNSSVNFRAIEFAPQDGFDCPTWEANANGYYGEVVDNDSGTGGVWKSCLWENSNTRTAYGNMINNLASYTLVGQFQTAFKNHPAWGAIDIPGWGNTGEAQYSSQNVTYVSGGTVNGNQSGGATQTGLTLTNPHTVVVGDLVKFADAVSGTTVTRNVTAVGATTITWASTSPVQVSNGATITRTGLHYGSTTNAGAEIPAMVSDGAEVPTPGTTAQNAIVDLWHQYFDNNFFTHVIGLASSPGLAYALGTKLDGWRADGWGFRVTPAACPTGGGNHMCSLYPGELGYTVNSLDPSDAYHYARDNTGPVNLEPYNNFTTWDSTPYDRDQSFLWARQAGASSMETKNGWAQLDTAGAWRTASQALELKLGYRLYPSQVRKSATTIAAPNDLTLTTTWYNRGSAPFYAPNYYVMYKFVGATDTFRYATTTRPTWLPGTTNTVADVVPLPNWLNADTYQIYIGIGYNNATARPADHTRPSIRLAISPQPADGTLWYPAGSVVVTNAAPASNPTYDYAAGFASASSQFLLFTDNATSSLDNAAKDFTIAARWFISDKSADRAIVSKGSPASATQNYTLYYDISSDRLRFTLANGTTVYDVDDTTLGSASTDTWYCSVISFNNTTKVMRIRTNDGTAITDTATGVISDSANNFRIGRDAAANYMNGGIDAVRMWTRLLTTAEETAACNSSAVAQRYEDMPMSTTEGLMIAAELDEATGENRLDSFQHWLFDDQATVTQISASTVAAPAFAAGDYGTVLAEWDFSIAANVLNGSDTQAANNDVIKTVNPESGSGDLTQATNGNRPILKTNQKNSLQVAEFDGTDDWLLMPNTVGTNRTALTYVMVFKTTSTAAGQGLMQLQGTDNIFKLYALSPSLEIQWTGKRSGGAGWEKYSSALSVDTWYALIAESDWANDTGIMVNNTGTIEAAAAQDGAGASENNSAAEGNTIGATSIYAAGPFTGQVGHIIVYTNALDATNRSNLLAALVTKWGALN